MAFESGVVPEDWRFAVIVPLFRGKGDTNECRNYRVISLLSIIGRIYVGILMDIVCGVTGGLINDERGGFREGSRHVD